MNLKLSAPKESTWIVAVIAGALGILSHYNIFKIGIGIEDFVLVMIGFLILAIATTVKGL